MVVDYLLLVALPAASSNSTKYFNKVIQMYENHFCSILSIQDDEI